MRNMMGRPSTIAIKSAKTWMTVKRLPVLPLFMDLPLLTGEEVPHAPHLAVSAAAWPGTVAVYGAQADEGYVLEEFRTDFHKPVEEIDSLGLKIDALNDFLNYKPKYLMAIGPGLGLHYGMMGVKYQIGYDGSGIFGGIGYFIYRMRC